MHNLHVLWIQKKMISTKLKMLPTPLMALRHLLSIMPFSVPVSKEAFVDDNANANGNFNCNSTNCIGKEFSYFHASSLEDCGKKKNLPEGKLFHAHMMKTGFKEHTHVFLAAKLVIMYAKCGSLVDARRILDEMPKSKPNVVSWTAMIGAYARHGQSEEAFKLYCHMHRSGVPSDHFTFTNVITACADLASLEHGKAIHTHVIRSGFHSDYIVGSALVDMYSKCRSIEDAREVFDKMPERDVVTWNTIVAGYTRIGHVDEAMKLFRKMPEPNVVSWTTLIAGCAQTGLMDEALELFEIMPDRNVVSWTAMIAGFAQNGYCHEALKLFQQMQRKRVELDSGTFASFLPVCADLKALGHGKAVHEKIIASGFHSDIFVGSSLVDMYVKCGSIEDARKMFHRMPKKNVVSWNVMIAGFVQYAYLDEALEFFHKMPERNVVSWTTMIVGYAQNGHVREALEIFRRMPERNAVSWNAMLAGFTWNGDVDKALKLFQVMPERNVASWNAIITGLAQSGRVDEALKLFDKMPEQNEVSWTSMIAGYAQNGHSEEAMQLFQQMQMKGVKPVPDTFTSVLPACADFAALGSGQEVHEEIIRSGCQLDVFVGNALIDMYAKCGCIEDARQVFKRMSRHDVVSWNALIAGYAMHGCGEETLQLFGKMQAYGINPDHVTFVGVLSACCHAGLVDDGRHYFNLMNRRYHISPAMEHYCCMVDLLGRAGQLDEAQDFINKMPVDPDATVWGSLLGACRIYMNVEVGEHAAKCLFQLDPKNPTPYVLLSNIYAAAGKWNDIEKIRERMKHMRVKKSPGCSWIHINNKMKRLDMCLLQDFFSMTWKRIRKNIFSSSTKKRWLLHLGFINTSFGNSYSAHEEPSSVL